MSIWLCIPSKRPRIEAEPVLQLWRDRGYKIALVLDDGGDWATWPDFVSIGPYEGYAKSVNMLCRKVMLHDDTAEWLISGGDDIEPDPNHSAEEIAEQCCEYFLNPHPKKFNSGLFGVMQCTGDRWGDDAFGRARWPEAPAYIDRIAGSPWMGREWCRRINGGRGPLWPEYTHCFADEELQVVAKRLGVFWQRPDLTHYHRHWQREGKPMPEFLTEANSPEHWQKYKALFEKRRDAGFPGSEPIA